MKIKDFIKVIGLGTVLAVYIRLLWTFLLAYFHPTKQVLISSNTYGEANIEAIMLLVTLPCVIYFIYEVWKNDRKV